MGWSYKPLLFQMVEKQIKRKDLKEMADLTTNVMAHISKNEPVTMDALGKICQALNCRIEEIVEYIPEPMEADAAEKSTE